MSSFATPIKVDWGLLAVSSIWFTEFCAAEVGTVDGESHLQVTENRENYIPYVFNNLLVN